MQTQHITDFGWRFPPTFSAGGKGIERSWGEGDINAGLGILLTTRPGEHPIYPQFGCSLDEYLFQQMDQNMLNTVQYRIAQSIKEFEPRIQLETIEMEPDEAEGKLVITVHYRIKATQQANAFTYEFKLLL